VSAGDPAPDPRRGAVPCVRGNLDRPRARGRNVWTRRHGDVSIGGDVTDRTKIERVGGHLLITGYDFINRDTRETYAASAAYPIASLVVDEKPTHVTVSDGKLKRFWNVTGW